MKLTTGYKKPIDSDGSILLAGGGHKTIQQIINDFGAISITSAISSSQAINADILGNATTADRLKNDKAGNTNSGGWAECKIENGIIKYYDRADTNSYLTPVTTSTSTTQPALKLGTKGGNQNYDMYVPYATSSSPISGSNTMTDPMDGVIRQDAGQNTIGQWNKCKIYNGYVYYYEHSNPDISKMITTNNITNYYWGNNKLTSSAKYNSDIESKSIKLGNGTTSTAIEGCTMQYDSTNKCLKFIF